MGQHLAGMVRSNMINLTKKQVGALLKFMPSDGMRPILEGAYIKDGTLYATNGFIVAALELEPDDAFGLNKTFVRRNAIERWYKLATGKSRLTTEELVKISQDDYAYEGSYQKGDYPEVKNIINNLTPDAVSTITINAEYLKNIQDLAGKPVTYVTHGKLKPLVAKDGNDTYVVLPLKD